MAYKKVVNLGSDFDVNALWAQDMQRRQPRKKKKDDKGFWLDQISTGGGIAGALGGAATGAAAGSVVPGVGTAIGGVLGALLGGGLGSAGGEVAENAITGDQLDRNVVQEGLIGGATSLPIGAGFKLARAGLKAGTGFGKKSAGDLVQEAGVQSVGKGTVAKGGRFGTQFDDNALAALERLGGRGQGGGIAGALGRKVGETSDSLSIKGLNLAPQTDLHKFKTRYKEDVASVIKRNNLVGKEAEEFDPAIAQLDDAFSGVVTSIPGIEKKALQASLKKVYEPLMKSRVLANKQRGQALKTQADEILRGQPKVIGAEDVNALRREFDSHVNYASQLANPAQYTVDKRSADALRKTIQQAADDAGLKVEGKSLKEIGREVSKLRFIQEAAAKRANNGRGSGPFGLRNMLGAAAGGGAGGVPGALAGATTTAVANSPRALRATAGALDNVSGRLGGAEAVQEAPRGIGQSLLGATTRQGIGRALAAGQAEPEPMLDPAALGEQLPGGFVEAPIQEEPSIGGVTKSQLEQAMAMAALDGSEDAFSQLQALYEMLPESSGPEYGSTAQTRIADTEKGLAGIDSLSGMINAGDYSGGVIQGGLRQFNPFDEQFKSQQAMVDTVRQFVGKALEGGVLRKEDEEKYKRILPTMQDDPGVANAKLDYLRRLISGDLENYRSLAAGGGGGVQQGLQPQAPTYY